MRKREGETEYEGRCAWIKFLGVGRHHEELVISFGVKGLWRDQFRERFILCKTVLVALLKSRQHLGGSDEGEAALQSEQQI